MHSLKQMNHKTISIDVEKAKKKKKKTNPKTCSSNTSFTRDKTPKQIRSGRHRLQPGNIIYKPTCDHHHPHWRNTTSLRSLRRCTFRVWLIVLDMALTFVTRATGKTPKMPADKKLRSKTVPIWIQHGGLHRTLKKTKTKKPYRKKETNCSELLSEPSKMAKYKFARIQLQGFGVQWSSQHLLGTDCRGSNSTSPSLERRRQGWR